MGWKEDWQDRNDRAMAALRKPSSMQRATTLILHSKGAKSGNPHTVPVMYLEDDGRYVVFASKGGVPNNPAWYHNLIANPDLDIEVKGETVPVHATEILGEERDRLFALQVAAYSMFGSYQKRAKRTIPVVALSRRD